MEQIRLQGEKRNISFDRNYMDYHSDRFDDFSLMFYKKNKLYALLPAHKIEDTLYSHFRTYIRWTDNGHSRQYHQYVHTIHRT